MSCADRPKKEKCWRKKIGELESLVLDIVDDVLGEYSTEQYEKDFKKLENHIEKAKLEAKIEVLEEVLEKAKPDYKQGIKRDNRHVIEISASIDYQDVVWILDNLKKKKK